MLAQGEAVVPEARPHSVEERWILSRPRRAARAARRGDSQASASQLAVTALYHLTFDDFCDWYAEAVKPRLYDGDENARATALAALERLLTLLHPVMPHVTEEIWSQFHDTRLIAATWPEPYGRDREDAAHALEHARRRGHRVPPQRHAAGEALR